MEWIPLWVDKWIFGSTRIELQPDERSVWVDIMAIASKDNGFIRANPETPYPPQQLAGLLCISEELLNRSLEKFIETGKIKKCGNLVENNFTGFYIINWAEYQLSDRHKRRFTRNVLEEKQMSDKTANMSPEAGAIGEDRRGEDIEKRTPFSIVDKSKPEPLKVLCNLCKKPYAIKEDHKCNELPAP